MMMNKYFKADFGFAAVAIYSTVIVAANLDKDVETLAYLVFRQSIITFFVTSTVVAYVITVARSEKGGKVRAYTLGALVPATIVAFSSFVAHWYFTNEYRNVAAPFVVSLLLNAAAVTFARAGHITLVTQLKHAAKQIFRRP